MSWAMIIKRSSILSNAASKAERFEDRFWSGIDLSQLYQEVQARKDSLTGSEQIFHAGFKEFARLHRSNGKVPEAVMEGTGRAMRVALSREVDEMETNLPFLATVGSISVYRPIRHGMGDHARLYRSGCSEAGHIGNGCSGYCRSSGCNRDGSFCRNPCCDVL